MNELMMIPFTYLICTCFLWRGERGVTISFRFVGNGDERGVEVDADPGGCAFLVCGPEIRRGGGGIFLIQVLLKEVKQDLKMWTLRNVVSYLVCALLVKRGGGSKLIVRVGLFAFVWDRNRI